MKFTKRNFGNNISRPFTGLLALFLLILMFSNPGILLTALSIPIIILAIVRIFGKEVVELDFEKSMMTSYFQVLFDFSRSQQKLENIDYVLVRDFNTVNSHTVVGSDSGYYEVCFVQTKGPRIILAYRESQSGLRELIREFEAGCPFPVKDGTKSRILGK